jgi:cold shock CspA family protein
VHLISVAWPFFFSLLYHMFHASPAHLQPRMHPTHTAAVAAAPQQQQQQMLAACAMTATTADATMFHGFPTITSDGRAMIYFMPSSATSTASPLRASPTTLLQSRPLSNGSRVPATATAAATSSSPTGKPAYLAPAWVSPPTFSTCSSPQPLQAPLHASDLRRSPPMLSEGPPPYAASSADKSLATAPVSTASSLLHTSSLLRSAAPSVNGMSTVTTTTAFDVSTTSNTSSTVNATTSTVLCSLMPAVMPPPQAATPTQPRQPCFWIDNTTGTMRAMTAEEMAATVAAPPPPPPGSFNASVASMFSASLTGAVPCVPLVAMQPPPPPPPPALPKTMNGVQYEHGELYEGFVKRYNPNRGFGFLTATYHVKPEAFAGGVSTTGSPAASLTAPPTSGSATAGSVKERRIPVHLGDIFVHQSYMHMQGFRTLPVGGRVRFRVGYKDGQQTFQAVDVELLPQVVPQNMEASPTTSASCAAASPATGSASSLHTERTSVSTSLSSAVQSPNEAVSVPSLQSHQHQHEHAHLPPTMSAGEFDRLIGPVGTPLGDDRHAEAGRCFFSAPKDKALGRSPVTLTQGESFDGDDEDDSPLVELAYEVYTSLEE